MEGRYRRLIARAAFCTVFCTVFCLVLAGVIGTGPLGGFSPVGVRTAAAQNQTDTVAVIKHRREMMKKLGDHMRVIVSYVKGAPLANGDLAARAAKIKEISAKLPALFPKGTGMEDKAPHPTGAKPEIWNDWASFKQVMDLMSNAAVKLETAAAGGDKRQVRKHFLTLGKEACSGCHKLYRYKLPDTD